MASHEQNLQIIDTLRRLNRIFVRNRNTKDLLSGLCKTLVGSSQFSAVWIALLNKDKTVEEFDQEGLGEFGEKLKNYLFSEGLNSCSRLTIEHGQPFFVEKDENTCEDCPLLQSQENTKTLTLPVFFQKELFGIVAITVSPDHELSELEKSLLNEFADDMGNALNTLQLEEGKEVLAETINRLTKSITGNSSREVITSFMDNLLISLDADYAFIGKLIPGYSDRIRTIEVCTPDGSIENFEYTLAGTPCSEVIKMEICCHVSGVADQFPEDIMLKDMGIEAYIGTPLFNSHNQVTGIMVVLKKTPFRSETPARYIFQVFAARGSSELMRYDTEQRILESETQYQDLIESSKNPIYIIVGNHFALVNSAWLHMFEYSLDEVMADDFPVNQIVAPESQEHFQRRLENFLSGISQPFQYEMKAISKSGKKFDLDVSVTHLNWQGKRAVQGVYRNITQEKNKEKQYIKDLKQATETCHIKTAFLSNLSQEIHSKLSEINKKASELTNNANDKIDDIEFPNYVINNTNNLLENIKDIQDIARIELGEMTLNPDKFNLLDVVKDVVQYFTPLAIKKGIDIICCKKKSDSVIIKADELRVRQILINLLSNAVKYTEKGQITIKYKLRPDDVKICIADTGVGIEPHKQKKIYQSFVDPNKKLAGNYDGTGLGLAVTQSLVELMRGKIWVESNSGGGTIFNITIPLS